MTSTIILRRQIPPDLSSEPRSFLGGPPRLTQDFEWPRNHEDPAELRDVGEEPELADDSDQEPGLLKRIFGARDPAGSDDSAEFNPVPKVRPSPMHFIGQICCEDLPAGIWDGLGPRDGWLHFFADLHGGFDFGISPHGSCRVIHTEKLGPERGPPDDMKPVANPNYPSALHHSHGDPGAWPVAFDKWPVEFIDADALQVDLRSPIDGLYDQPHAGAKSWRPETYLTGKTNWPLTWEVVHRILQAAIQNCGQILENSTESTERIDREEAEFFENVLKAEFWQDRIEKLTAKLAEEQERIERLSGRATNEEAGPDGPATEDALRTLRQSHDWTQEKLEIINYAMDDPEFGNKWRDHFERERQFQAFLAELHSDMVTYVEENTRNRRDQVLDDQERLEFQRVFSGRKFTLTQKYYHVSLQPNVYFAEKLITQELPAILQRFCQKYYLSLSSPASKFDRNLRKQLEARYRTVVHPHRIGGERDAIKEPDAWQGHHLLLQTGEDLPIRAQSALYFFVKPEDLERHDFSNVTLLLEN